MTIEEKQIHNAVHVKLQEFDDFISLVKRMREAQNNSPYKYLTYCNNIEELRRLESEVDEWLEKLNK